MALGSKVSQVVMEMALPIAQREGCTVYDVEYKKEGSDYVMRVILDTQDDSPVSITMCENVSRALSEELDKNDPTGNPYVLEVTSPVGLYKQLNGSKIITGRLLGLNGDTIVVETDGSELCIKREDASFVRLAVIF